MHTAMEHVSVKVALTHRVFLQGQVYRMPRNVKGIGRTGKKHKKPATGASSGLVGYWGRWRRVPASAGARHLKVRRHLLLRVLRRRASWTRSTPGAPLARPAPPLRAPQPPRAPHAPIPHLPAAARSRPCVRLRAQAPTIFQGVGRRRTRRTTSAAPTTPRPAVAAAVAPVAALVAASALAAPVAAPCSAPLF